MSVISDAALSCGYRVIFDVLPTCMEITGNGDWEALVAKCLQYVSNARTDHVSIVFRDPFGNRELRDIGDLGKRRGKLPSVNPFYHPVFGIREPRVEKPKKPKPVKPNVKTPIGVRWRYGHYYAVIKDGHSEIFLGIFEDPIEAAKAHDKYAVEHHLKSPLNFPAESRLTT